MGYTLEIGEAKIESDESGFIRINTTPVMRDDAPAFGEATDKTSARWPSYSSWAFSMEMLGLTDVMFSANHQRREREFDGFEWQGEEYQSLINNHPGVTRIVPAHVAAVEAALAAYRVAHPTSEARFPSPRPGAKKIAGGVYRNEDLILDDGADGSLARGEWLLYWLKWAVENCECPVFFNS